MRIRTLADLRRAKILAELARGMGFYPHYHYSIDPEPPFVPFVHAQLNDIDAALLEVEGPWDPEPLKRMAKSINWSRPRFEPERLEKDESTFCLQVALSERDDGPSVALTEQFLRSFKWWESLAFEIVGTKERIIAQFAGGKETIRSAERELTVQFPAAGLRIEREADPVFNLFYNYEHPYVEEYCLSSTHFHPIALLKSYSPDPLGVLLAALSGLSGDDWAGLQVLFQPVRHNWQQNIRMASRDEFDSAKPSLFDFPNVRACDEKAASPLFAVTLRLASTVPEILDSLESYLLQFTGPLNGFAHCPDQDDADTLARKEAGFCCRTTFRFGMLLSVSELSGLVHLPSPDIASPKLMRVAVASAPAPHESQAGGVEIGLNQHRGVSTPVRISPEHRNRHAYLIGSTRVGKTTLMLNMILQDIAEGHGVGVIDPHGDLIREELLPRIPKHRLPAVVYLDPDDREFPVAFNVLSSTNQRERELVCTDLLVVFQRLFGESWGPRLEHILRYLVLTLLERPGTTLRDVRRLIDDQRFRVETVEQIKDPELTEFWEYEFASYSESAFSPIRNKLGKFLAFPTVRNMLLQPENHLDFGHIMDSGKILLCNLSQGALGEEVSNLLGALVVSRIQIAAMGRASRPRADRRDFYLYVDEFQNYVTSSFEKILSEAGKYRLNLTLANQFLKQLPEKLQSAILDNVGTLICFHAGTDVARRIEKELGQFSATDIVNLKQGEAIVRMGSAREAFNLKTNLPAQKPDQNYTDEVIRRSRDTYAKPRGEVEDRLRQGKVDLKLESPDDFYEA